MGFVPHAEHNFPWFIYASEHTELARQRADLNACLAVLLNLPSSPVQKYWFIPIYVKFCSSQKKKKGGGKNAKGGLVSKVLRRPFHPVKQTNLFLMYPCVMKYSFDCYWHFCQPHYMSIMGLLLTFRGRVYWMAFINVDMLWPVADALSLVKGPFSGRIFKGSRWGGGNGWKGDGSSTQGFLNLACLKTRRLQLPSPSSASATLRFSAALVS